MVLSERTLSLWWSLLARNFFMQLYLRLCCSAFEISGSIISIFQLGLIFSASPLGVFLAVWTCLLGNMVPPLWGFWALLRALSYERCCFSYLEVSNLSHSYSIELQLAKIGYNTRFTAMKYSLSIFPFRRANVPFFRTNSLSPVDVSSF